jgi:hypothetical protein
VSKGILLLRRALLENPFDCPGFNFHRMTERKMKMDGGGFGRDKILMSGVGPNRFPWIFSAAAKAADGMMIARMGF